MQVLAVLPREPEIYLPRIGHHFWSEKTRHSQSPLFDVVCYLDLFSCRQVLINTLLTSLKKKLHCSFHLFCFALVCPVHRVIVLILSVQPAFAQAAAGPASSLKKNNNFDVHKMKPGNEASKSSKKKRCNMLQQKHQEFNQCAAGTCKFPLRDTPTVTQGLMKTFFNSMWFRCD